MAIELPGSVFRYYFRTDEGSTLEVSLFRATFTYDQAWQANDRLDVTFDRDGRVREVSITARPKG